ncbi:MAG: Calx-beta domain-containing protein [Synechococcales bacterium]|nr:Calx-beta domain-containing protein [Synechococcales bacterium]
MEFVSEPLLNPFPSGLFAPDAGLPGAADTSTQSLNHRSFEPALMNEREWNLQDASPLFRRQEQSEAPPHRATARGENIRVTGRRQTIRGTADNDRIDGRRGKQNRLLGLRGNDRIFTGQRDRAVGGPGDDRIDGRRGRGRNLCKGGGGNDQLFARNRDRLLGNGGNDTLDALRGRGGNFLNGGGGNDILIGGTNDQLVGGSGSDEFWVAQGNLPATANTVIDFEVGVDQIGINRNLASQFNDLQLEQQGGDTLVRVQGSAIAILRGIDATTLSAANFIGIDPSPQPQPQPQPQLAISDITVLEGNAGTTNAVFTLTLSAASNETVQVAYATENGTAIAGSDYTASSGTVTFAPGQTTQTITIPVLGDLVQESNETFALLLGSSVNAELSLTQAIATILNDEISLITAQTGNLFSQTASDRTNIESQFTVVGIDDDGNPIPDTNPAADVGEFVGAITIFDAGAGRFEAAADFTNIVEPFEPDGTASFTRGTLVAEFIDDPLENQGFGDRDTVEYRLLASGSTTPILLLRLDFSNPFDPIANFDPDQATNSLAYILEQGLLQRSAVLGDFNVPDGLVYNTQVGDTYTRDITDLSGSSLLTTEFRVVDRLEDGAFIADTNSSSDFGLFVGAIAAFSESGTFANPPATFTEGNLTTSRSGTVVTYTLASLGNSITRTASLDLALLSLDATLAVNDLGYILENDLLPQAFFA